MRALRRPVAVLACLAGLLALGAGEPATPPTREEVEARMGLPSQGDRVRGMRDTVGFVVTAEQAEELFDGILGDGERRMIARQDKVLEMKPESGFLGGICPHDDHLYAGRVYVPLTERITAPRVVLIGVFHGARHWDLENRLVFDGFESWHGPWGPVPVDALRRELLESLPTESVVVSNAMHEFEHSLEAIVPFLQHRDRDVSIVPILVPYMNWEKLSELSDQLAGALATAMQRHDWRLGSDVAVVISSDSVHYGKDFEHAPFGLGPDAYVQAVERDEELIEHHLTGPLTVSKPRGFLERLVEPEDVRQYRIPWCGRFSIPFGVELLRKTTRNLGDPVPVGHFLRYGTSLSEPEPPVSEATRRAGLGYTAPSNFHHWVGYAAIGYLPPSP
jgi:AmmeMemoRadiSam system protein B